MFFLLMNILLWVSETSVDEVKNKDFEHRLLNICEHNMLNECTSVIFTLDNCWMTEQNAESEKRLHIFHSEVWKCLLP